MPSLLPNLVEKTLAFEEVVERFLQQRPVFLADRCLADGNLGIVASVAEREEAPARRRLRAADDLVLLRDARLGRRRLFVAGSGKRLDGRKVTARDGGDELVAVGFQELLHTLDRIAVIVEEVADALEQVDILGR